MRAVSPSTFLVNSLPYVYQWSPGVSEDLDESDVHKPLLTQSCESPDGGRGGAGARLCRRISAVNWRNVITIVVTVVDYYLVYSPI